MVCSVIWKDSVSCWETIIRHLVSRIASQRHSAVYIQNGPMRDLLESAIFNPYS
jgi:hypothetical protein